MPHKRPLLALKDAAVWLQCFQSVPDILGNIHAEDAVILAEHHAINDRAVVVEGGHTNLVTENDEGLIFVGMMVNGDFGPRFQGIKHTMA